MAGQTGLTSAHGLTSTLTDENAEHVPSFPALRMSSDALWYPGFNPARFHVTIGPSPMIAPSLVVHLYLIGLPLGETAFAVSCTRGAPLLSQARTMFASEARLSVRGALAAVTTCAFWAKTLAADRNTT